MKKRIILSIILSIVALSGCIGDLQSIADDQPDNGIGTSPDDIVPDAGVNDSAVEKPNECPTASIEHKAENDGNLETIIVSSRMLEVLHDFLRATGLQVIEYRPFPWPGPFPGPTGPFDNGGCAVYNQGAGKPLVVCCTVNGETICWEGVVNG